MKNKRHVDFITQEWHLTYLQAERPRECKQQPTVEALFVERKAEVFGCSDRSLSWIKITLIMLDLDLGVVGFCMRVSLSLQDFKSVSQSTHSRLLDKQQAGSGLKLKTKETATNFQISFHKNDISPVHRRKGRGSARSSQIYNYTNCGSYFHRKEGGRGVWLEW